MSEKNYHPEKNYHHGDLRAALVSAARTILERDGLSALSLRACAREAGVSHAAPQHHFHSVADLQASVAASGFDDFVRTLDELSLSAGTPRERLIAMGKAYVQFADTHPALYRLMFGVEGPHVASQVLQAALNKAWNQLYGAVVAVSGENKSAEHAMLVWSVVHGHSMLMQSGCVPPVAMMPELLSESLDALLRGILSGRQNS